MLHFDHINLVTTNVVRKKRGNAVETRCAVCRIEIHDTNVPENGFWCNFCLDFYVCETCFKTETYGGKESAWEICPADTMMVADLLNSHSVENKCSICKIEVENRYSR